MNFRFSKVIARFNYIAPKMCEHREMWEARHRHISWKVITKSNSKWETKGRFHWSDTLMPSFCQSNNLTFNIKTNSNVGVFGFHLFQTVGQQLSNDVADRFCKFNCYHACICFYHSFCLMATHFWNENSSGWLRDLRRNQYEYQRQDFCKRTEQNRSVHYMGPVYNNMLLITYKSMGG